MALTRQLKEQHVKEATDAVSNAVSVVFMAYDAFNASDVKELREKLYEEKISMRVMPKRLLKIVMKNTKIDFDPTTEEGQLALIWGDDAVAPAKVLHDFAKKHENIKLVAGSMDGATLSSEEVMQLAKLPSREELLGKLVGTIAGPMRGFVSVLSGVPRNAVYVLHAIADQKS